MSKYCLIVNQDRLHVFEQTPSGYKMMEPEGRDSLPFDQSRAGEAVGKLENILAKNERPLFIMIASGNKVLNKAFQNALGDKLEKTIRLEGLLINCLKNLGQNHANCIDDFGVNYDGRSYNLKDGRLVESSFSLLAYTIMPKHILDVLEGTAG